MGNNLQGVSLLSDVDFTNHVQLGSHATIDVTKAEDEMEEDGVRFNVKKWNVSYTIDGSRCELELRGILGKDRKVNTARFILRDDIWPGRSTIPLAITKGETGILMTRCPGLIASTVANKTSWTIHAWGGVTETTFFCYGSGTKGGLVVWDKKKKSRDERPYMWTVAHYYAANNGNIFGQTRIDIGLSVIVKVELSNDVGLDFTIEGPRQHPAAALFYMFDEVKRTGIWKPTSCPHCANIQRQRSAGMFWQSESEDSDGLPPPRLHGPRHNPGSVLANDGKVKGNYNGNFNVKNLFLKGRQL